jgi:uncharacterized protein YlxW (UPF0749 family)
MAYTENPINIQSIAHERKASAVLNASGNLELLLPSSHPVTNNSNRKLNIKSILVSLGY